MPSIFSSVTGRNAASLFDIRLDSDFIVFRGNEHESAGQMIKGVVVLCLPSALRMEDVRLRLTGTLRINAPGSSSQKGEKNTTILEHRWAPFVGTHGKSMTLPAGNYEYPFEYLLPGDTAESVEGIPEASITYRLKATVGRGKLAYDLHAYKHLRVIRAPEPGALEFLHAMSVENIWPNKIDYSIIIPQKAVVFGGTVKLQMRLTPLLKGLEMGEITAKMVEIRETCIASPTGLNVRDHKIERDVSTWKFGVNREEHWHDMIEDTGQEGWALEKQLTLPKKLRQCIQDLNLHGIKVRHKIKLTIALENPDGHISELRATLPISIFISPNLPLDDEGNLIEQAGGVAPEQDLGATAPPGYGEHVLDQLYDEVEMTGFQTPAFQSGVNSPFYIHSRAGSSENLAGMTHEAPFTPSALSSRLADVSIDPSQRNTAFSSGHHGHHTARSEPASNNLTRHNSSEDDRTPGSESPQHIHIDESEFAELNKVPSYSTALRMPASTRNQAEAFDLPDYQTALSAPRTPPAASEALSGEYLPSISEDFAAEHGVHNGPVRVTCRRSHTDTTANGQRLHILQARDQMV
ncbi:unnamed protein product [Clonostachys rhizophaga]|uniref:Arrestin C-terminal-like domain-containing protein n=1 Tax=Clonostachys rhizophaga TaxID=160324 RepID=A0A9N9YD72_9HYPO|nr:unnamed protein product [Clonostachys rhizophaga]